MRYRVAIVERRCVCQCQCCVVDHQQRGVLGVVAASSVVLLITNSMRVLVGLAAATDVVLLITSSVRCWGLVVAYVAVSTLMTTGPVDSLFCQVRWQHEATQPAGS